MADVTDKPWFSVPAGVPDDRCGVTTDYQATENNPGNVTCWRRPEQGASHGRCIWHADDPDKPPDKLAEARTDHWERLDGAILRATDLEDTVGFDACTLVDADLSNADLSGVLLRDVDAPYASFQGATLRGATATDIELRGADLSGAAIGLGSISKELIKSKGRLEPGLGQADFSNASFRNATARGTDFAMVDLRNADFHDSVLVDADFHQAELQNAAFTRANLLDADLSDSNLRGASFTEASLPEANLTNALVRKADFTGATLTEATLTRAAITDSTFTAATLVNTTAHGISLTDSTLTEANLRDADLSDADLAAAELTEAVLFAADLSGATLSEADLTDAYLADATLTDATCTETQFQGAFLRQADLTDGHLQDAALDHTDFGNATMSNADLRATTGDGVNFGHARMSESDLRDSVLTESNFTDTTLTGATLQRGTFTSGDFRDATLTGSNLENATVTEANLFGADLPEADLYGANIGATQINRYTQFGDHYTDDHIGQPLLDRWRSGLTGAIRLLSPPSPLRRPNQAGVDPDQLRKAAWSHRQVENTYDEYGFGKQARAHNLARKEIRRRQYLFDEDDRSRSRWIFATMSKATMQYGESPWRVVGISTGLIAGFGLVYPIVGGLESTSSATTKYAFDVFPDVSVAVPESLEIIAANLYFSAVTFTTLGYGDIQPGGPAAQALSTIESFVGALLMAMLVFVLGRRATW